VSLFPFSAAASESWRARNEWGMKRARLRIEMLERPIQKESKQRR